MFAQRLHGGKRQSKCVGLDPWVTEVHTSISMSCADSILMELSSRSAQCTYAHSWDERREWIRPLCTKDNKTECDQKCDYILQNWIILCVALLLTF